jgi:CheY-like chemotaxis protein
VASEPGRRRAGEAAEPAAISELDTEVTRIGATPSQSGASLAETLRGALATVGPLARRRGVQLRVETAEALPPIAIDRAVLRQILVNLLVAAIQHGARRVTVGAEALLDAARVTLVVRLRGPIDGQVGDALDDDESLHVARRLLQLQSGTAEVQSIDAATLAVRLKLPVLQPATVLLVDDNPDTLRLFRRYLNGGTFRPIDATTGRQALELARQVRPRVIVLDVMLPSQDGWEVLQALKHDWETEAIPVVICSVLQQRELAVSLGAADFLEKPVSRDSLLQVLQRQLGSPGARPTPLE